MAVPALLDRSRAMLAVIDVQEVFLAKLPEEERAPLVARIAWLIRVAGALGVPVVAMGEDTGTNGPPVAGVRAALPEGTTVWDKRVFGLAGQPDIRAAVAATRRTEAVLVGLETDVCVAQSALGLMAEGMRVAVVADATASPGAAHAAGLARMAAAGATVVTAKSLYYEWVRDLDTHAAMQARIGRELPAGLAL